MALIDTAIGISQNRDLIQAAEEAAQSAKQQISSPKLLLVYFTLNYPVKDYAVALKKIQAIFSAKTPLVGGSVFGFFTHDQSFDTMIAHSSGQKVWAVAVVAITSNYLYVGTGLGTGADKDAKEAGKTSILNALDNLQYNPSVAYLAMLKKGVRDVINIRPVSGFVLSPGPGPSHPQIGGEILEGISSVVKRAVRMVGGGTMGGLSAAWPEKCELKDFFTPHQFYNGKVYAESVISVVFGSDLEIGYGCVNGYRAVGPGLFITKGEDWMIDELDGQPAAEAMWALLEQYTPIKKQAFLKSAIMSLYSSGYAFGQPEATADFYWPSVPFKTMKDKAILNFTKIRKGASLALLQTNESFSKEDTLAAINTMAEDAGTKEMELVLVFSSAGRNLLFKDAFLEEAKTIRAIAGQKTAIFGIITGGTHGFYGNGPLMDATSSFSIMGISNKLISEVW